MNTYTFETVNPEQLGSAWGYHRFVVQAPTKAEAWDAVRKLTQFALKIVAVE